jgi:hypothetical protein
MLVGILHFTRGGALAPPSCMAEEETCMGSLLSLGPQAVGTDDQEWLQRTLNLIRTAKEQHAHAPVLVLSGM